MSGFEPPKDAEQEVLFLTDTSFVQDVVSFVQFNLRLGNLQSVISAVVMMVSTVFRGTNDGRRKPSMHAQ